MDVHVKPPNCMMRIKFLKTVIKSTTYGNMYDIRAFIGHIILINDVVKCATYCANIGLAMFPLLYMSK